jgi:biotin transporter BioY
MLAGLAGIYVPGVMWLTVSLHWISEVPTHIETLMKIGLAIPLAKDLLITYPAAAAAVIIKKSIARKG